MSKNAQHQVTNNTVTHYRLVTVLANQEAACPPERLDIGNGDDRVSLSSVAQIMHVPVGFATYPGANGMQTFATHGFSNAANIGPFAAACNRLCSERALVIPDIAAHVILGAFAGLVPKADIRFLVGISLGNSRGQRVGSLVVMNSSKAVASRGISFKTLMAFSRAFSETGRLHAELIAADPGHFRRIIR